MGNLQSGEAAPATLIERARRAKAEIVAATAVVSEARSKLANMKSSQQSDQIERERLRREKEHDDALRMIDGEDAVPKRARRDNRLAKLDEEAAAKTAAIRLQEARLATAEAAEAVPQAPFAGAILDVAAEVQGDAVEEARAALAALAPAFARLIAADQIRTAALGDRYPLPVGTVPPFSGTIVIRNTVNAIPERLLPPELSEQRLFEFGHAISSDIITQIEGI